MTFFTLEYEKLPTKSKFFQVDYVCNIQRELKDRDIQVRVKQKNSKLKFINSSLQRKQTLTCFKICSL